jgi:hypothetical protein
MFWKVNPLVADECKAQVYRSQILSNDIDFWCFLVSYLCEQPSALQNMHAGYIVVFMAKHEFDADKQQAYEQRFDVRLSRLRPRPYRENGFVIFDNSRIVVRKHSSLVRSLAIHYADCGDCVPYCGIGGCKSQDKATPKVSVYHIAYSDRDVTAVVVESMDAQLDSKISIEGACDW